MKSYNEHKIDLIAKTLWEGERRRINDQNGINARATWNSNTMPWQFWENYRQNARDLVDAGFLTGDWYLK